jgi:hypothetical protein
MPPPETAWHEQQHSGLPPTMNLPGPQGQQGQQLLTLRPPGVNQMNRQGHQGHQGQLHTTGPPGGGGRSLCPVWQRLKRWWPHREGHKLQYPTIHITMAAVCQMPRVAGETRELPPKSTREFLRPLSDWHQS